MAKAHLVETDLASLARTCEQCRSRFNEIERSYEDLIRRIVDGGDGADLLEADRLGNARTEAFDTMEDADITFELAVTPLGLHEDHPIRANLKRRREALARRRR
jgi:hypothetical protein